MEQRRREHPTLAQIASLLSVPATPGAQEQEINGIETLDEAGPDQLSFVGSEQYVPRLAQPRADHAGPPRDYPCRQRPRHRRVRLPLGWPAARQDPPDRDRRRRR